MDKWTLDIGYRREVSASRESCIISYYFGDRDKPFTSLKDVKISAQDWARHFISLGLTLRYAHAISPEDVRTEVLPPVWYRQQAKGVHLNKARSR